MLVDGRAYWVVEGRVLVVCCVSWVESRGVLLSAATSFHCLSPCLQIASSCLRAGFIIQPFFLAGFAGQLLWVAGLGPWQLAHRGLAEQSLPVGPSCLLSVCCSRLMGRPLVSAGWFYEIGRASCRE